MDRDHRRATRIVAVVIVIGLAACVGIEGDSLGTNYGGKDFPIENLRAIEPGKTTKAEVLRLLGRPRTERHTTLTKDLAGNALAEPKATESLQYHYWEGGGHGVNGVHPHKFARLLLIDSVVISYTSSSSFKRSTTDFDFEQAVKVEKGSRVEAIVSALGPPSGRGIYPSAGRPAGTSITYEFISDPCRYCEGQRKLLIVLLNAEGGAEQVNASLWTVPGHPFASPKRLR